MNTTCGTRVRFDSRGAWVWTARFALAALSALIAVYGGTVHGQGTSRTVPLSSVPSCGACAITLSEGPTLRPPTDAFFFDSGSLLFHIGNRFVATMVGSASPILFDSTGAHLRSLLPVGDGPGEISAAGAGFIAVAPGDSLWVMDFAKRSRYVFSPELRQLRTDRPVEIGGRTGVVFADGSAVFTANIRTPERAGLPLHLVGPDGAIVKSFGRDNPSLDGRLTERERMSLMLRKVVPASVGNFWAYNPSTFLLELWSRDGVRLASVDRAQDGWFGEATRARPQGVLQPYPLGFVIPSEATGVLWLGYYIRRDPALIAGDPLAFRGIDMIVEAVDTGSWTVLASRRFTDTSMYPVLNAHDLAAVVVPVDNELRTFRIVRLTLHTRSGEIK